MKFLTVNKHYLQQLSKTTLSKYANKQTFQFPNLQIRSGHILVLISTDFDIC
jgi:hypothetical protein